MNRLGRIALLGALAGCGRFGFDPLSSGCETASTLFCDDFESGDLSRWLFRQGDVAITTPAHGGANAARASISEGPGFASLSVRAAAYALEPALYLRAWVYFPAEFTFEHTNLLTLQKSANAEQITVAIFADAVALYLNTSAELSREGGPIPRDTWSCLELDVTVDDVSGGVELRLGGSGPPVRVSGVDSVPFGGIDELILGITFAVDTQPAASLYLDDIVLAATPPGCGP